MFAKFDVVIGATSLGDRKTVIFLHPTGQVPDRHNGSLHHTKQVPRHFNSSLASRPDWKSSQPDYGNRWQQERLQGEVVTLEVFSSCL